MDKTQKVSVYVPVYNGENTIELCIKSLLNQSKQLENFITRIYWSMIKPKF